MPRRTRLDAELVRRGLARSREHASQLIADGRVTVRGTVAAKAATAVETDAAVVVRERDGDDWASRGAHKLIGALDAFEIDVTGRRALDAGASTGGFTDVLLRRGAREVVAADVGRGLLVWRLQTDDRVLVLDKTNVRALTPEQTRRAGRPRRRRPLVHLVAPGAARAARVRDRRCRPAADGQAAVRGRQGTARLGWRGARS